MCVGQGELRGGFDMFTPPSKLSDFQSYHSVTEQKHHLDTYSKIKKSQIGWKSVLSVQHFTAVTWLLSRVLFLEAPGVLEGLPYMASLENREIVDFYCSSTHQTLVQ